MVSRASRRAVAAPKGRGWSYNGWQNKFEDRGKYHGKQKPRIPLFRLTFAKLLRRQIGSKTVFSEK